jgi:hypothetical protein
MGFYVAAAVQATQHSIIRVLDAEKQVGEVKTLPAIIDLIVRPSDDMLIVGFANGEVKMLALDGTITPITSLVGLTMMALSDSGQFLALGNALTGEWRSGISFVIGKRKRIANDRGSCIVGP